jgi:WD40 repeat protein
MSGKGKGQRSWQTYSVHINPEEATGLSPTNPKDWEKLLKLKAEKAADFSPDGRYVAFVTGAGKTESKPYRAEHSDGLEVWDFRADRLVAQRTMWKGAVFSQREANRVFLGRRHVRYTTDGRFIVASDSATIHVFSASDYQEVRQISFGPLPTDVEWFPDNNLEVSPDSRRIAVLHSTRYRGGLLRIYDLGTAKILWERRLFENEKGDFRQPVGLAWSPDDRKLAVTWVPVVLGEPLPGDVHNLVLLDAATGETLLGINTGYVAGPVAFGANNTVMTASLNPDDKLLRKDTIKIWDADTGKLLREIPSPPGGVREQLQASADGRIVMGYVGRFKYNKWSHFDETIDQRFRLWDALTGEVVATSPEILPLDPYSFEPRLRLSATGDLVLVWRTTGTAPPIVYELH